MTNCHWTHFVPTFLRDGRRGESLGGSYPEMKGQGGGGHHTLSETKGITIDPSDQKPDQASMPSHAEQCVDYPHK